MKQIAVLNDTHMPAGTLPEWVHETIGRADHTIRAGDFETSATFKDIRACTDGRLTAVRGNRDLALVLPSSWLTSSRA